MKKTPQTPYNTIAVCSFEVREQNGRVQLFPAGTFKARDGRPRDVAAGSWLLNGEIARAVLAKLAQRQTDIVIDYEHQTLLSESNGKPAPAAGWIKPTDIVFEEGAGLFATAPEWTEAARGYLAAKEYRYISPVFSYDPQTGAVTNLLHVALTNFPALDGMEALTALAAARFDLADKAQPTEENAGMNRDQLIAYLGLSSDASDDDINTAMTALKARGASLEQEVAALKTTNATLQGNPDPMKYVPLSVVEELKQEIAALRTESTAKSVDDLIAEGLNDGRLLPAQEKWARDVGQKDIAALKGYLDTAQPIAALKGRQTEQQRQVPTKVEELSVEAVALCKVFGTDPADYLKTLAQE